MCPRSLDVRAVRTRNRVQAALLRELLASDLADLSVTDILRSSGVSRSTFYRHYDSLGAVADDVVEQAAAALAPPTSATAAEILARLVEHVQRHRQVSEALFSGNHSAPLIDRFTVRCADQFHQAFQREAPSRVATAELDATMLAHATVAGIRVWLRTPHLDAAVLLSRLNAYLGRIG